MVLGILTVLLLIGAVVNFFDEKVPKGDPKVGCGCLYVILVVFSGLSLLSTDKERNPVSFNVYQTILYSPLILIIFLLMFLLVFRIAKTINETINIRKEELGIKTHLQEQRNIHEKENQERRARQEERDRLKDNLIATGLFSEDDPWEKYDDDDNM